MSEIYSDGTESALPFSIAISSGGGVTGLTVVASIRNTSTTNSYLDFNDATFKTTGWTNKTAAMSEVGGGVYTSTVDIASITNLPSVDLTVEFDISGALTETSLATIVFTNKSIASGVWLSSSALTLAKFLGLKDEKL